MAKGWKKCSTEIRRDYNRLLGRHSKKEWGEVQKGYNKHKYLLRKKSKHGGLSEDDEKAKQLNHKYYNLWNQLLNKKKVLRKAGMLPSSADEPQIDNAAVDTTVQRSSDNMQAPRDPTRPTSQRYPKIMNPWM